MAFGYRIQINEIDRSQSVQTDINAIGAMVVRASRGPSVPRFFSTGRSQEILDWFGAPDASNPDIWNAIEYNNKAPIWLVTPKSTTDRVGGVIVAATGVFPLVAADPADADHPNQTLDDDGFTDTEIGTFTFSNETTDYFVLLDRTPCAEDHVGVFITHDNATHLFTIKIYSDVSGAYELYSEHVVSMDPLSIGDFGKSNYIGNVLANHPLVQVLVNPGNTGTGGFLNTTVIQPFVGSVRTAPAIADTVLAWNYFRQPRQYAAKVFMDTTCSSEVAAAFSTLRSSYQKYSSYIIYGAKGVDAAAVITAKAGLSLNSRGLAFYWNHGYVSYGASKFWVPLVGRVGVKYAQMTNVYNGLAPFGVDENEHGGQLGSGIEQMEYDPSDDELLALEKAGINPVIFDPIYGVMICGQRTAISPGTISDDSYVGHSRLFDYLIENIQNQVLVYQVSKLNDDKHRKLAVLKGRSIIQPVREAGLLNDYLIKCDAANNNADVLAVKKFVYTVAVQVTPFSEWVTFNFIKAGQQITVEEALK
jgi:hypothetical protein